MRAKGGITVQLGYRSWRQSILPTLQICIWKSARLWAIAPSTTAALAAPSALPPLPHQTHKPLEQVAAVARAGRGLGMVLHREHRLVLERDAAVRAVEQRHMRLDCVRGQRRAVDREAMVHRGDLDLAGGEVLHRMVRAMVALMHLAGGGANRDAEHLVAEADAERWHAAVDDLADHRHRIFPGCRRIARAVGEEHAVGLER